MKNLFRRYPFVGLILIAALIPLLEMVLPKSLHFADALRPIIIFAILGLGLNIITGFCGMLHLGVAGLMAVGAYGFAILTCDIYPFQIGFFLGLVTVTISGMVIGTLLALPTMRLTGDYLAIVTLGFGEIIQNLLRNMESITKGTQGINPLPHPMAFGIDFMSWNGLPWFYLLLILLALVAFVSSHLEHSRIGRAWSAISEDELAASCMGIPLAKMKLMAVAIGSGICALAGALWASYLGSSGEPGNYDFQVSVVVLCVLIVGGLGSITGILIGALLVVGFNSIFLVQISNLLARYGISGSGNVMLSPNNWKFMVFGFALIIMMRCKPDGLWARKLTDLNGKE